MKERAVAVRTILPIDHPLLRVRTKKIHRFDPALRTLVAELFATLHAAEGAGLAAPQIGQSLRVCVAEYEGQSLALVNPEIVASEGELRDAEGCLSLPGYVGVNIRRAARVVVRYRDPRGRPLRMAAEGYFARILQHEIDHLDGVLFLDHLDHPRDLRALPSDDEA
jgi:peptide deformylase